MKMSKTLGEVRKEIDKIDNQVHDLLMQRAELVSSVVAAKRIEGVHGVKMVQPAREAKMIRRLLARHKGPLPRAAVVRIWRELVGSVAFMQTGFNIVVVSDKNESAYWDMAKNYFGSVVPMKKINGAQNALRTLREDKFSFAVMPWPELNSTSPWWSQLFNQQEDEKLSVICALPYGHDRHNDKNGMDKSLVVSKAVFSSSEEDITILGIELDSDVTRDKIMDIATKSSLKIINLYSALSPYHANAKIHFLEVDSYIDDYDLKLNALAKAFGKKSHYCGILGGYPVVPDIYNDLPK